MSAPHRARRALGALLCAAALAAGGCGMPSDDSPHAVPTEDVPDGLRADDSVAPKPPTERERVRVYFVRDDRLVARTHLVAAESGAPGALAELLAGPNLVEQGESLRTAIADRAWVDSVEVARGVATVAIDTSFSELPANDQLLAVAQMVLTLTDLRGIGRVAFAVDGVAVAVPIPDGEPVASSVSRDDYASLIG